MQRDYPQIESDRAERATADRELVARVRKGDQHAYGELWRRHHRAGLTAARAYSSSFDPEDLVAEAYTRIYSTIRGGKGPQGAFRPYLYASIRNTAINWSRKIETTVLEHAERIPAEEDTEGSVLASLDRGATARAFRTLPARWQEVLWYTEVERIPTSEISSIFGISKSAVAVLAFRAREGLRKAWIQAHLNSAVEGAECRFTIEALGSYTRSGLSKRERARIEDHLAECTRCALIAAEADRVGSQLGLVLLPIVAGAAAAAAILANRPAAAMAATATPTWHQRVLASSTSSKVLASSLAAGVLVTGVAMVPAFLSATPSSSATHSVSSANVSTTTSLGERSITLPAPSSTLPPTGPTPPPKNYPLTEIPTPGEPRPPAPVLPRPTIDLDSPVLSIGGAPVVVSGSGLAGSTVHVRSGSKVIQTARTSATGRWTLELSSRALPEGAQALQFVQSTADNYSDATSLRVLVDRHADPPADINVDDADGRVIPILTGTAEPGSTVSATFDGHAREASADSRGRWSLELPADSVAAGETLVSVRQVDTLANSSNATTVAVELLVPTIDIQAAVESYSVGISGVPLSTVRIQGPNGARAVTLDRDGQATFEATYDDLVGSVFRYAVGQRQGVAVVPEVPAAPL